MLPEIPTGYSITKPGVGGTAVEKNKEEEFEETIRLFRQYYKDHANDHLKLVPAPPDYGTLFAAVRCCNDGHGPQTGG